MSEEAERLYEKARALPPEARAAFVRNACRGDPELADELLSLLEQAEAAEEFFGLLGDAVVTGSFWAAGGGEPTESASSQAAGRTDPPPCSPELSAGHTTGRYRILQRVGVGGMGIVYRARDTQLEREVALKFLPRYMSTDTEAEGRLLNEARAAAALEHPNVCTVHEIGETEEGQRFIAMAFYGGETLKERLRRGPLPPAEAARLTAQLARGLAAAHARGIVHGDVKPGNVMLTADGTVKLLDFGLAQMADVAVSRRGTTRGTVPYMSPEQIRGEPLDARTDLWSLGVVLYEMLTGVRPFREEENRPVLRAILHDDPQPVTERRPETPEPLARIVERLLQKEPDARYASAGVLRADLARAVPSADGIPRLRGATRRGRALAVTGAAAALVALVAGALWLPGRGKESVPAFELRREEPSVRALPLTDHGPDLFRQQTPDVAAYELYLRGNDQTLLRSDSGVRRGVRYFKQAIALDSTYAAAHAGLARMSLVLSGRDDPGMPVGELQARAREAALKAVSLDDSLADAHAALGLVRQYLDFDFASAETELRRAVDLDPNRSRYLQWLAQLYIQMGRPEKALPAARRALEIDPLSATAHAEVAHALLANGQHAEALDRLEEIAALQPPLLRAASYAAQAYARKGMWPEAIAALRPQAQKAGRSQTLALYGYMLGRAGQREDALRVHATLLDRWREGKAGAFEVAVVHAGLGDLDRAFAWLDRSVDDRSAMFGGIHIMEPVFEELRRDPRFERLRRRLGLQNG